MKRHYQTRLGVHPLEDRAVPAVAANVVDGVLVVQGATTSPGAELRVDAKAGPVRVFDGTHQIGSFTSVKGFDIRPGGNANVIVDLGVNQEFDSLFVSLSRGVNSFRFNGGIVNSTTLIGVEGNDRITVVELNSRNLAVDTGLGNDEVLIAKSSIGVARVNSAEHVDIPSSMFGSLDVKNMSNAMAVSSQATIQGDFSVFHRGGSLQLGGAVRGNVTYSNFRPLSAANIDVTGMVEGSFRVVGTQFSDVANFSPSSHVGGNLMLDLGGMDDALILAGAFGQGGRKSWITADLGDGNDQLEISKSAKIQSSRAWIDLGAGRDKCFIAKEAYFAWLSVDGGPGVDFVDAPTGHDNLTLKGFDGIASTGM